MHHTYTLPFGATLLSDGQTRFRLWAPSSEAVFLDVEGQDSQPMQALDGGWHEATLAAAPGTRYRYRLADGLAVPDPASRLQAPDAHDPSVVVDPNEYDWRNDWQGRPWHEAVVYEVHAGAMGGFSGIRQRLPELQKLGVTAIEIMPVADFPGGRNWGYDGVLPYAPDTAYGTPAELKALIDDAHGLGLMVMLDVVYNHFGPDGAYLHAYAKPFFREDITTPWGAAIDFRRPEVCDYFIQNALYWLMEYRFDGLRFDAVHAISEEGFLRDLARTIRGSVEPDRQVHLVLEHENNRAALLRANPEAEGFDAQWADDFHHCVHVLLTGESEGYYEDFQDATSLLADCLGNGFAYQGQVSPHLGRPRGEPSGHLPTTAFVVCLQNHDQIGNRAMGDRLTTLANPQALRAATALLLLCPFVPMLFMGEEYAARNPFLFFTSHNENLAKLVREGRRAEFKHFAAFQDEARRAAIPDPNAPSTFDASVVDKADPATFAFVQGLLALRRQRVVPGIPGCRSLDAKVIAAGAVHAEWQLGTGERLAITLNLGQETASSEAPVGGIVFSHPPGTELAAMPPGSIVVQVTSG